MFPLYHKLAGNTPLFTGLSGYCEKIVLIAPHFAKKCDIMKGEFHELTNLLLFFSEYREKEGRVYGGTHIFRHAGGVIV